MQAVEGMEVKEESSDKVKLAIKTNAWRNRAMILLDGAVKPSLRYISKSIKEVCNGNLLRFFWYLGMVMDPQDSMFSALGFSESMLDLVYVISTDFNVISEMM